MTCMHWLALKAWMVHDKPGVSRSVSFYHSGVRLGEAPSVAKLPPLMALSQLKPLPPSNDQSGSGSGKPSLLAGSVPQVRKRGNLRLDENNNDDNTQTNNTSSVTPSSVSSPLSPGPFAQPPHAFASDSNTAKDQ
jgi:hypothetical protein